VSESTPTAGSAPRAVVVGTGFGCRIHVPALRAAGFEVAALVGTDAERTARRAERSGIARSFTDVDEAIAATGAVAVTVATPPNAHAPVTLAAIARGCHVICEKPFARNTDEAREMLDSAVRAGVTHLVGNEFRWSPERNVVMRAITDGLIGEPRLVTFLDYNSLVADPAMRMPRWWFDPEAGGGWLGAQGSHLIDQVRTWLGEFDSVSAALGTVSDRDGSAEDSYLLRFRMASGADGVIQQTAGAWGEAVGITRVAGSLGTIWLEGQTVWLADRDGTRALPTPPELVLPPGPAISDDPRHLFSHLELVPYTLLCKALRDGVEGRPLHSVVPLPTFADGLAATQVLDAIRLSAASQGAVVPIG
jgi:predicted dehydrogenase